jgi:hypothetical protein
MSMQWKIREFSRWYWYRFKHNRAQAYSVSCFALLAGLALSVLDLSLTSLGS